ncbi:glutathione hydrolase 1 proenzyme-like isoform X1 [Temnothorax curvispinosus]|uniref:Glutathione hydrolase 1 proenzyme-like isoform X1 n=1 Tax=Temnothorax curvispinosus TaxID=300111 RepID=A0A6J1QFR5_9HYME|nr:glutathione hydrolase 1 proenzyme-like isoform X1 [Temnothorax curvispinosus]XP_024887658.1 glutathione hydrolase 1 proenzyme-like isoform X1 [Temnothorax curvispinosus]
MVRNGRHVFQRKVMRAFSPSSDTSSVYTSADDARRCTDYERSQFLGLENIGTAWLLGSHSSHDRTKRVLERFKIDKSRFRVQHVIIIGAVVAALIIAIIIGLCAYARNITSDPRNDEYLVPPDPESFQPPSWSKLRTFKRGAVCADGAPCAVIGKSILERNGSAVDAALAALICNGLVNMQSLGLGGGFIMTIYQRSTRRAFVLNARDRAPLASNSTMYDGKSANASSLGALAVAVPGELAGYWEAHQQFGRLPWADLFKPSIELCEKGYVLTLVQYDGLAYNKKSIYNDPTLRELFVDPATNKFRKPGSVIKPYALCETLRIIAEKNATEFYNGTIGRLLVNDLQEQGGIITMKDLNEYRVSWDQPIQTNLSSGIKLLTTGIPGGGAILSFILNVFDDYGFTPASIADFNATILTYHRMIETFKYAFALRTNLGDGAFIDMTEITRNLTSKSFAHAIREKIDDTKTWQDPRHYGSPNYAIVEDHGTAHVSVLAPNGDAVSATSTINFYFGSGIVSRRTGILLNNGMDDFSIPSQFNYFGMPPSPNNYIAPKKQPLSSMVPSVLIDRHGDVKMVMGAAGGTRISTAVSQVTAKILWMKQTVKEAVDSARIHHQLFPSKLSYEYGIPKQVVDGLKRLGHVAERYRVRGSVACFILYENSTIFANADYRKGGDVYGID